MYVPFNSLTFFCSFDLHFHFLLTIVEKAHAELRKSFTEFFFTKIYCFAFFKRVTSLSSLSHSLSFSLSPPSLSFFLSLSLPLPHSLSLFLSLSFCLFLSFPLSSVQSSEHFEQSQWYVMIVLESRKREIKRAEA